MTLATTAPTKTQGMAGDAGSPVSPGLARALVVAVLSVAIATGVLVGNDAGVRAAADPDLARLLRAMAAMKAVLAAGAVAAIIWRLRDSVGWPRLLAYALACAAMAAGPGLIWTLSYVGVGAVLLHAGLFGAVLLLWRDPAVSARLAAMVSARRSALAVRRRS